MKIKKNDIKKLNEALKTWIRLIEGNEAQDEVERIRILNIKKYAKEIYKYLMKITPENWEDTNNKCFELVNKFFGKYPLNDEPFGVVRKFIYAHPLVILDFCKELEFQADDEILDSELYDIVKYKLWSQLINKDVDPLYFDD